MAAALLGLGVLAAASILAAEIPGLAAWPSAFAALAYSRWLVRRELHRPVRALVIPARDGAAMLDGMPMTDLDVQWRGPLAFIQWRDTQEVRQRLQFWPDMLPARARRELRLAMINHMPAPAAGSMAP